MTSTVPRLIFLPPWLDLWLSYWEIIAFSSESLVLRSPVYPSTPNLATTIGSTPLVNKVGLFSVLRFEVIPYNVQQRFESGFIIWILLFLWLESNIGRLHHHKCRNQEYWGPGALLLVGGSSITHCLWATDFNCGQERSIAACRGGSSITHCLWATDFNRGQENCFN